MPLGDHFSIMIRWSEADGAYVATHPELPGCRSAGGTTGEALDRLAKLREAWLAAARDNGEPVPAPVTDDCQAAPGGGEPLSNVVLTGAGVILRELAMADVDTVQTWAADPEVVRFMTWGPNRREDTENFVAFAVVAAGQVPRRQFHLAVVDSAGGEMVGTASLTIGSREHRRGEIGYCLGQQHWGRGLGTAAARALLDFGFSRLGLHRIQATCAPGNHRSARVLEKLGMRREGHIRDEFLTRGTWRDSLLYAVLAHEWPKSARCPGPIT